MSSILTNTGAMVALQNLKSINKNLASVQGEISTGKKVGSAKDNAAVWAISKVMEADVESFKAISSSLSLGESTTSVARQASETVTDLLTEMKKNIVASQEENVDRDKIQTDIAALRDQINSVVGAAQFNGLNMLSNKEVDEKDSRLVSVLSSLDRSDAGVASSEIDVTKQDLGTEVAEVGATGTGDVGSGATITADGGTGIYATLTLTDANIVAGLTVSAESASVTGADSGDDFSKDINYVTRDGDTLASVTEQMVQRLNFRAAADGFDVTFSANATTEGQIDIVNNEAEDIDLGAVNQADDDPTAGENDGVVGGGLELINEFDVSTADGAKAALGAIEGMIQTAIDSSAAFGSAQGRIEIQSDFVGTLTDALTTGIGTLVDANMEEASARLQALQVQQQLGVQSLSIANQAPQSLLSLFR